MAMAQPRIQAPYIPGQKEPVDVALEQKSSQSSTSSPGKFMSFSRSSSNAELKGTDTKEEEAGREQQEGDYYAPVPTKIVRKETPKELPSSGLDGIREGAEMNDLYSPEAGVTLVTSDKQNSPQNETKDMAAATDEHEQRGEDSGTVASGPGLVEASKGMANDMSETLVHIRGRVMEKLSVLQLPSESLEAVRKTFETGKGAYTTTVDAVQRTKQSLLEILPSSLSSSNASEARKVVEDMEQDMLGDSEGSGEDRSQAVSDGADANIQAPPTSEATPLFMRRSKM